MDADALSELVRHVLAPERFLVRPPRQLVLTHHPPSEVAWEIYLGHLLAPSQTRNRRRHEVWQLALLDPHEPVTTVHWDVDLQTLFITRSVLVHGWEPFEESPGVISSRPAQIWQAELIGEIELLERPTESSVRDELGQLVQRALVGTSRLPITSVESPLPSFAWGQIACLPADDPPPAIARPEIAKPASWVERILHRSLAQTHVDQAARGLEFALRCADESEVRSIARWLSKYVEPKSGSAWFRRLFQQVSLAPHTTLIERIAGVLAALADWDCWGAATVSDIAGYMLRHLCRHLTAYDLVTFHSFGANYPDALWLDALLRLYLDLLEQHPALFLMASGTESQDEHVLRLRRRALRQAWLTRWRYEGHLVPAEPTSQGELRRVLPGATVPRSADLLQDPSVRTRSLFTGRSLEFPTHGAVRDVLDQALLDLTIPDELRELGTGTFADRPFGLFKDPGEVDRTPLVAYQAFSRRRAAERLQLALDRGLVGDGALARRWFTDLTSLVVSGVDVSRLLGSQRPGVIMLEDARQASDDFIVYRTARGSLRELAALPAGLTTRQRQTLQDWSNEPQGGLLIRSAGPRQAAQGHPLLTWLVGADRRAATITVVPPAPGSPVYRERAGVEYLAAGLRFDLVHG